MITVVSNWAPAPFRKALIEYGVYMIKMNFTLNDMHNLERFDLIYYARFTPPLISKDLFTLNTIRLGHKVIYGLHMPLTIDHKVRPSHYVYDVAMITQAMIAKARGFRIHASNMTDYNIAKSLGLRPIYLPLGTDTTIFKCRDKPDIFTVIYASWPA